MLDFGATETDNNISMLIISLEWVNSDLIFVTHGAEYITGGYVWVINHIDGMNF